MWEQVREKMDTHKLLPNIFLFTLLVVVVLGSNSVSAHITKTGNEIGEQALSQIAIEKAVYALHESASVSVHPRVLGLEGEDTQWVTVDLEYSEPSENDWVGVFSPAMFK
ncbi:hypothetical protein RHMOL_Rhmol08G0259000 [Rhododendron molle]|uniref:Uncharacterized protein n=1 Tax=Rhododendron molle TaxID=49168 RepID=A0ACC0MSS3_RHOML|nr:hypothetical protein RHMOL_Rhmol08G0259000 [Rhododendron molle]